jgi:hypothetical protein
MDAISREDRRIAPERRDIKRAFSLGLTIAPRTDAPPPQTTQAPAARMKATGSTGELPLTAPPAALKKGAQVSNKHR